MAHRRFRNQSQRSRQDTLRRRQRGVSLTGAISAFLTFGLGPLTTAPPAKADEFGIDDLIANLFGGAADGAGAAAGADPASGLDFLGDISTLDPSFAPFMQEINTWLEANWINTPLGQQVDNL
ncbi:MAG: hypothetical protein ACRDTN_12280, partial [Mycobacterium sp.]